METSSTITLSQHDKYLISALLLGLVLFCALAISVYFTLQNQQSLDAWVKQSAQMNQQLRALALHTSDAENAARAYAISGEINLLLPYQQALNRVPIDIVKLRELTQNNAAQQQRLQQLTMQVQQHLNALSRIVNQKHLQHTLNAWMLINNPQDDQLQKQVYQDINVMVHAEQSLLVLRQMAARNDINAYERFITIDVAIVFLLTIIVIQQLIRDLFLLRRTQSELLTATTQLDHLVAERTAELLATTESLIEAQQLAQIGSWSINLATEKMSWSTEMFHVCGMPNAPTAPSLAQFLLNVHPDDLPGIRSWIQGCRAGEHSKDIEFRLILTSGEIRYVMGRGVLLCDTQGHAMAINGTTQDITERKHTEIKLLRLSQLYAALSQCNQAIVRCNNENELFQQICRDAVNFGGMRMAWIAMLDAANKQIKAVSAYGSGVEYLNDINITVGNDRSTWVGPTSLSIRDNQPVWCQDFQHNSLTAAWHERGQQFGWGASAALPLCRHGIAIGAIVVYSHEINAFDPPMQNLLIEMATDVSHALDSFADEAARIQAELAVIRSEARLQLIINTNPECVKVFDKSGRLLEINKAGLSMLEVDTLEQVQQRCLLDFVLPAYHTTYTALFNRVMQGESDKLAFEIKGLKGTLRWVEMHAVPMYDQQGNITALLGITHDITQQKQDEQRIHYLANFDALTGLSNRTKLADQLNYALSLAKRSNGRLAVMFVDIDRFKDVNDSLGHSIGDSVLKVFALRIKAILREEDIVARLGGDEFFLMLPGNDALTAAQVAQKILLAVSYPIQNAPYDISITASIGIALYPDDGITIDVLTSKSDTAMYRAKHDGRNNYLFFTEEMQALSMRNAQLLNALRHALERKQFEIYYQPQLTIDGQHIIGAEALLRWHHPELGAVSPAEFIPIAEDNGLILIIGEWVLQQSARQLKYWLDNGYPSLVISVNLSAVQLRHTHLTAMIAQTLQEIGLPVSQLELELTESVAMHEPLNAIAVIHQLHALGIRVSIDDFGTGYSSLSYLKKFRVYKLKIDQSFVRDIITDPEDRAIVAAIIGMAKSLGLKTIAEGVENTAQLDFLREQGCDEVQGYYYSKPLTAEQFEAFLNTRQ